jgi:hypothetical protein
MATTANTTSPSKPAAKRAPRAKAASTPRASTQTRAARPAPPLAERAVLIPVGAALIARERVASGVGDVISIYSSPTKAQTQLRKFERRGATARNRLEREVRKTRTRVERELRQRRRESGDLASRLQERVTSLV